MLQNFIIYAFNFLSLHLASLKYFFLENQGDHASAHGWKRFTIASLVAPSKVFFRFMSRNYM